MGRQVHEVKVLREGELYWKASADAFGLQFHLPLQVHEVNMAQNSIRLDKNGVKVVRFFMDHPEREMSSEEISSSLKIDDVDAGIILNSLEKSGFLEGKAKGLTYQYKVSGKVLATQINTNQVPGGDGGSGSGDDSTRYIG